MLSLVIISLTASAHAFDSCPWEFNNVSRDSIVVTPATIMALPKSSNVRAIVSQIGPAARDVGSGMYVLQWDMSDGHIYSVSAVSACAAPISAKVTNPTIDQQGGNLVGIWRFKRIVQSAEGKVVSDRETTGNAIAEFKPDGTWTLSSPQEDSIGTYWWVGDRSIKMRVTKSNTPNKAGWTSTKIIQVYDGSLRITTVYDEEGMR